MNREQVMLLAKHEAIDSNTLIAVVDTIDDFGEPSFEYAPPAAVFMLYPINANVIGTFAPDGTFTPSE